MTKYTFACIIIPQLALTDYPTYYIYII